MLKLVTTSEPVTIQTLDELAREGARAMIAQALVLEAQDYCSSFKEDVDENGRRLVVRNGTARARQVTVGSGTIEMRAPRVDDRRDGEKFSSKILPPYVRKSPKIENLLPLLYLKGLSTSDFQSALEEFLGAEATAGLSASSITALKQNWEKEYAQWKSQKIRGEYAYIWADGVHVNIRLGEDKRLCLLVIIGVHESGEKHLLAVEPGYRESTDSWAAVLRDLRKRGLKAPLLAIGDGALGFWKALRTVDGFQSTREQRCWVHKTRNVLDALPKRLHAEAKTLLHEITGAPTKKDAEAARDNFKQIFGAKYEKAVEKIEKSWSELVTFFDFPAEHWKHLRTTNPIESSFAQVKLRARVTKGAGSTTAATAMAFKLLRDAEENSWKKIREPKLLPLVLKGVAFKNGIMLDAAIANGMSA